MILALLGCHTEPKTPPTHTGGTSSTAPAAPCADSTPIQYPDGSPSGLERCADGRVHRVADLPNPGLVSEGCSFAEGCTGCSASQVCGQLPTGGSFAGPCECAYTCSSDADCAKGQACIGAGSIETEFGWPTCSWAATCRTDADCGSGLCGVASFVPQNCSHFLLLACFTASDTCTSDADCSSGLACIPGDYTTWTGPWTCADPGHCTDR